MKCTFLFSVPRSGSTWVGELFNSSPEVVYRYQPLFSYAFKGALHPHSTPEEMSQFFEEVAACDDPFLTYGMSLKPVAPFEKETPSHLVLKEVRYLHVAERILAASEARVVGLVRNPLAVLSSWARAPKEFDASWDFSVEWRSASKKNAGKVENFYGFDAWKETTSAFLDACDHPRFRLLEYERLLRDPKAELGELFDWCGIPRNAQTDDFLADSGSRDDGNAYGVHRARRTRDDGWKGKLPEWMVETVKAELRGTELERFLYES